MVGLDDALIELSLQANFLASNSNGFSDGAPIAGDKEGDREMRRTFPQFGIDSII